MKAGTSDCPASVKIDVRMPDAALVFLTPMPSYGGYPLEQHKRQAVGERANKIILFANRTKWN